MPIKILGNSNSNNSDRKIDTSWFVQKPSLRTNFAESNIEENIDSKNQNRIKNVPAQEKQLQKFTFNIYSTILV